MNWGKDMKTKLFKKLFWPLAVAALMVAPTRLIARAEMADTDMERALVNSGFKVRAITTADGHHRLRGLPDNQFERVSQNGETYYLYADKRDGRLYVGDHWAYQAYVGFVKNNNLRKQGAFVFEVHPGDKPNNKTVVIWPGYPPFRDW